MNAAPYLRAPVFVPYILGLFQLGALLLPDVPLASVKRYPQERRAFRE